MAEVDLLENQRAYSERNKVSTERDAYYFRAPSGEETPAQYVGARKPCWGHLKHAVFLAQCGEPRRRCITTIEIPFGAFEIKGRNVKVMPDVFVFQSFYYEDQGVNERAVLNSLNLEAEE